LDALRQRAGLDPLELAVEVPEILADLGHELRKDHRASHLREEIDDVARDDAQVLLAARQGDRRLTVPAIDLGGASRPRRCEPVRRQFEVERFGFLTDRSLFGEHVGETLSEVAEDAVAGRLADSLHVLLEAFPALVEALDRLLLGLSRPAGFARSQARGRVAQVSRRGPDLLAPGHRPILRGGEGWRLLEERGEIDRLVARAVLLVLHLREVARPPQSFELALAGTEGLFESLAGLVRARLGVIHLALRHGALGRAHRRLGALEHLAIEHGAGRRRLGLVALVALVALVSL